MTETRLESKCYNCIGQKCPDHKDCRQWLDQKASKLREDLKRFRESLKQ